MPIISDTRYLFSVACIELTHTPVKGIELPHVLFSDIELPQAPVKGSGSAAIIKRSGSWSDAISKRSNSGSAAIIKDAAYPFQKFNGYFRYTLTYPQFFTCCLIG